MVSSGTGEIKWNQTNQLNLNNKCGCAFKRTLARCTFQLLQDPDISWSPYSRILEAACRDREQRQSGPSITCSCLMKFDVFFWFQINDSCIAIFQAQCLKNPKDMGWNLKYHGSVDAAFCVSQLSSWPHPGAQQSDMEPPFCASDFGKIWKVIQRWKKL